MTKRRERLLQSSHRVDEGVVEVENVQRVQHVVERHVGDVGEGEARGATGERIQLRSRHRVLQVVAVAVHEELADLLGDCVAVALGERKRERRLGTVMRRGRQIGRTSGACRRSETLPRTGHT